MAYDLQISAPTGKTLYAIARNRAGQVWNTSGSPAFENQNDSHWANYVLALTEAVAGSSVYFGSIPALAAGVYLLPVYERAGASNDPSDSILGSDVTGAGGLTLTLDWTGTAVTSIGVLSTAPDIRPAQIPASQNSLSFAQNILNQLYTAKVTIAPNGFTSITVDGQQVTYASPSQINADILFWERKVAFLSGKRRRLNTLRLDRF